MRLSILKELQLLVSFDDFSYLDCDALLKLIKEIHPKISIKTA